ncbi:hypothetical protein BXZ70DRAFT_555468 [Cristinia sonorae]|uniref:F-box domain-containing protein n=1 Tax=Cristinia sonorae TaxID=1940300 RepID=A0A8K0UGE6_9AGAR|nr:hypothetical protein BXZ70DRAFT_555468 [Cristinia sonorae]
MYLLATAFCLLPSRSPQMDKRFSLSRWAALPVEVCENIIEFCWGSTPWRYDDHATLYACALTCRSWYPRSQSLLYRNVLVSSPRALSRLISSLRFRPANGRFILHIRIQSDLEKERNNSWIGLIPLRLMPLAKNIMTVKIMHVSMTLLHPTFLIFMSRFQTVTDLSFRFVVFPTFDFFSRLICAFRSLRRLDLEMVPVSRDDPALLHHVVPRPRDMKLHLEQLSMTSDGRAFLTLVKWLLLTPSPTTLKKLAFTIITDDLKITNSVKRSMVSLLQRCGPRLQELDLNVNQVWIHSPELLFLGWNTKLRSFRLDLDVANSDPNLPSNSTYISFTLNLIGSITSPKLEILVLRFHANAEVNRIVRWDSLDSALLGPTFRNLKTVVVTWIHNAPSRSPSRTPMPSRQSSLDIAIHLPKLHAAGVLKTDH